MKAGSFCNEVLGQKGLDAGGATLPEKGNQSGQLLGGPAWGHLTCQGPPSLDRQSAGLGQHLRLWSLHELQPHGIRGGRWIPATAVPALLQCPCRPIPPACPLLGPPVLPCGGKLIWKEGLGRKIR